MPDLFGTIAGFARSPAGRRAMRRAGDTAQRLARDPRTRDRVRALRSRVTGRQAPPPDAPAGPGRG